MKKKSFLSLLCVQALFGMEFTHDDDIGQLAERMQELDVTSPAGAPTDHNTSTSTEEIFNRLNRRNSQFFSQHFYCTITNNYGYPQTCLCDKATGCCLLKISGSHPEFSPDEQILAVRSDDKLVQLWHLPSGTCLGACGQGEHCHFSPDSKLLCHCYDGVYHVWDIATRTCIFEQPASQQRGFVHFLANGVLSISDEVEAICGPMRYERVFDVYAKKLLTTKNTLIGTAHLIGSGYFTALATHGCVKIVDDNGTTLLERCGAGIEFFAHNQLFFIERGNGSIALFDVQGTCLFDGVGHGTCLSLDGTKIIAFTDEVVTIYDRNTDQILAQVNCARHTALA